MTSKAQKDPNEDGKTKSKRPRGMGGVLLIMALLTSLFLVVARSNQEGQNSIDGLYSHLLNGRVEQLELSDSGQALAHVRVDGKLQELEVFVREMMRADIQLYRSLVNQRINNTRYASSDSSSLKRFADDVQNNAVHVSQVFFVNELEPRSGTEHKDKDGRKAGAYLTAILQTENSSEYVRLDPQPASDKTLQQVAELLQKRGVPMRNVDLSLGNEFRTTETNQAMLYLVGTIGPWVLILAVVWFFILRQMRSPGGTGGVLSFGRSRAQLYTKENRTNITFDDVAGMDEAKAEVREIIEFLKNPQKFARLGGSIPRGVLLVGSPGTGKTLLARAIAGEAEVPFFSISGSDFVEMFVGVGASRVRDLFKQARETSPCIVFLDEIDAVGRKRGTGMGGGHDEREQTLNAILVEMDGFDSDRGIILVGATNRPDVLDPALLRPGRFDRQVVIDLPDAKGREAILKVHARKVRSSGSVNMQLIAKATSGFSGAELAAVVNESAILAAMKNKDAIEMSDLEEARDRVRWGREKRSRAIEEADRKVTAYHEAGHAIVSCKTPDQDPVHKVTIVSRGRALGATMSLPEKDDYNHWRRKLLGRIAVCYGGRVAEDLVFGDISAGAQNDIEQATNLAKLMVCELGMSEKAGPVKYTSDQENPFLGREFSLANGLSEQTLELINDEVRRLIEEQYAAARRLLIEHRTALDQVAAALLKHETLSGDEVVAILRGDDIDDYRAAQLRLHAQAERPKRTEPEIDPTRGVEPQAKPGMGLSQA
ncbi:MAG: ATP-dependent zinc metalloprotease FtsH [Planctomycetota bacterium]|nr:ATP-dependent zinc metalloprotease FtsH [Planctomycetota bacterium]